jgi:hypothetical protein
MPVRAANLALSVSMNLAGGGPDKFTTNKLMTVLFGSKQTHELAALRKAFGLSTVATFFKVSDFAVPDAMALIQKSDMQLPDNPVPPPDKPKLLAAALYKASLRGGKPNAEALFDALLSQPLRVTLVKDIDAKFGDRARAQYDEVLSRVLTDLHS